MLSGQILKYLDGIREKLPALPSDIELLDPFQNNEVHQLVEQFYTKFYNDENPRIPILGINPGRFGAGLTGIPFTDSRRLESHCKIKTSISSHETSSEFIYHMIECYGGVKKFYGDFFISSVSPLGFTKNGKNYNYYDDPAFANHIKDYIIHQIKNLIRLPVTTHTLICLGEGKNYEFLSKLNNEKKWFSRILPLPHPRFIMQYKRKQLEEFTMRYMETLQKSLEL